MRWLVRFLAIVCLCLPSAGLAATYGDPVAFQGRAGINVFWPFGSPTSSGGSYPTDPYSGTLSGPVSSHLTAAVAAQVKLAGFDFVRLQVDVGPCIQAEETGGSLTALDAAGDAAAAVFEGAGVDVLWSPYFGGGTSYDQPNAFMGSTTSAAFQALEACEAHWASRYAALYSPAVFAEDLFNEPPLSAGSIWQTSLQPALWAATHAAAPNMTLVATAENYGDLTVLSGGGYNCSLNGSVFTCSSAPATGLNPGAYPNTLFTFHQFLPTIFADQGEAYSYTYKYVTGLSFPPQAREQAKAVARMTANLNADTTLTTSQRQALLTQLTNEIGYYTTGWQEGGPWIAGMFGQASAWCTYWHQPPSSVLLGEFAPPRQPATWINGSGATVPNADSAGLVQGADRLSVANYDAAVASATYSAGFRNAVDHLDTYDLGITTGAGSVVGPFDPLKLNALAPAMGKMTRAY